MNREAFEEALLKVKPLLTELSDDFVVVVLDRTGEKEQAVSYIYGDPKVCKMLAEVAQFKAEQMQNEIRDSGPGGLSGEFGKSRLE